MEKQEIETMRAYLSAKAGNVSTDDFAEHILRNYPFEERAKLGDSPIAQAYSVLRRNLSGYEDNPVDVSAQTML